MTECKASNSKEYRIKIIWNSIIYIKNSNKSSTKALQSIFFEKLFRRKKYLETSFRGIIFVKANLFILYKLF